VDTLGSVGQQKRMATVRAFGRPHPGIRLISVTSRRAIAAWQASSISSGASESNAKFRPAQRDLVA
jgi:hypothetical protein